MVTKGSNEINTHNQITIKGARLHNLKNVTATLPKGKFIVATGLSGSGKSTLVFDILYAEGKRQYMESMGLSADMMQKPLVDEIEGLMPAIAIEQQTLNLNPRSTVGTETAIFTYLRLLYGRIGHRPCPRCGKDIPPSFDTTSVDTLWDDVPDAEQPEDGGAESNENSCPHCGKKVPQLTMSNFSFNTPAGACETCTGLGTVSQVNTDSIIDQSKGVLDGAVSAIWSTPMLSTQVKEIQNAGKHYGFSFDAHKPVKELGQTQRDLLIYGVSSPEFQRHYPGIKPPRTASEGKFEGVLPVFQRRYQERANDAEYRAEMEKSMTLSVCPACHGDRLRPESLQVTIDKHSILSASRLSLSDLVKWLKGLAETLPSREATVADIIITNLEHFAQRLVNVGVGYLTLERSMPTLSPGESQRIRMASLLGSGLTSVLYVLDEPTTGLHPRDNALLIASLERLRNLGNTVIVIEHDLDIVQAADYIIELGPGAGEEGGEVTFTGTPKQIEACKASITGQYLSGEKTISIPERRNLSTAPQLLMRGARAFNLKDVTLRLPLGGFVSLTGVSGSGKSTLLLDVLDPAIRHCLYNTTSVSDRFDSLEGLEHIDKIITIDQLPVGRTNRSNAATYTEAFDPIRKVFAATDEARRLKFKVEHFSFNSTSGRCDHCQGAGVLTVKMQFLPGAFVRCPVCQGRRFNAETLAVKYQGHSIADVLDMTILQANTLFQDVPSVAAKLSLLVSVGLGYLRLGQPATTLSGGEAQRIKLAKELSRKATDHTLYLLDEPTTGLHVDDVARLLIVLQGLVEAGNTVIVIEHNLDIIKSSDWVIDMGPEGGAAGGNIVAEGTPEQLAKVKHSYTGQALRNVL